MNTPEVIEVLHIDDCPNWTEAGRRVRAALTRLAWDVPVTFRLVSPSDEAARVPFAGSPTIAVDGQDLFPTEGATSALACRIYLTPDGLAGLPAEQQIRESLRAAFPS